MKVLFEVPLAPLDFKRSSFSWLSNRNNWLFIIEDGKRIRTFNIEHEPAKELQSATLTDTKSCTSLSWNYNSSLLALVVDKRQIYLWDVQSNQFTNFKPNSRSSTYSASKRAKSGDIELVAWSQVTNKLVVGYSTGKLLLCNFSGSSISERLVDNSEGLLQRVASIETSKHLDIFVCLTTISELLVMSFDGEFKFYIQIEGNGVLQAKFSEPIEELVPAINTEVSQTAASFESIWLACQVNDGRLLFKKILLYASNKNKMLSSKPDMDIVHSEELSAENQDYLVDFHWLDSTYLIACFSSGRVMLHQIVSKTNGNEPISDSYFLTSSEILNLGEPEYNNNSSTDDGEGATDNVLKSFELINLGARERVDRSTVGSFAMLALKNYRLFYYQLFKLESSDAIFVFEKVDDLDLTSSLKCKGLQLERIKWSLDGSMLAIQLTNAHILVYRTQLQNYLVASNGSKVAYLSDKNEVTILDYALTKTCQTDVISSLPMGATTEDDDLLLPVNDNTNNRALNVIFNSSPSVIGVGPKHLAMALNNRVWFYQIASSKMAHLNSEALLIDEQEYASIVVELQLCSRFVAVLFSNGRLKLHAIQQSKGPQANKIDESPKRRDEKINSKESSQQIHSSIHSYYVDSETALIDHEQGYLDDERFFPDPANPDEHISAFILTEELFIYCTKECYVNVFSLKSWTVVQTCGHHEYFNNNRFIVRLYGNERANKFVCLAKEARTLDDNVCLYDLRSNNLVKFFEGSLYATIFGNQLETITTTTTNTMKLDDQFSVNKPKLNRITDCIWDSDGRSLHLVSGKFIHSAIVLDHTLEHETEGTVIEFAATICKPLSYKVLYASNGIISFQTSLGRVINSIMETHDDDLKLARLKTEIDSVYSSARKLDEESAEAQSEQVANDFEPQLEVMRLKMLYFRTILSIHSLTRCKEIAEYLMSDEFSTGKRFAPIDQVIWKQLAARALFTMNLNFALVIYRKYGLVVFARVLSDILADTRKKGRDSRRAMRTRLLVLLNCEMMTGNKERDVD